MAFSDDEPIGHLTLLRPCTCRGWAPSHYAGGAGRRRSDAAPWRRTARKGIGRQLCNRPRGSWPAGTSGRWRQSVPTTTVRRACSDGWLESVVSRWYVPPDHSAVADGSAKCSALAAWSRRSLERLPIWCGSRNPPSPPVHASRGVQNGTAHSYSWSYGSSRCLAPDRVSSLRVSPRKKALTVRRRRSSADAERHMRRRSRRLRRSGRRL